MPRPSHVRDAVTDRIRLAGRHSWTVEEMLSDLLAGGVRADFSSVFRSLVWSEGQGLVQRIELGDGKTHFDLRGDHHEHAQCERCGAVTEIPGCLLNDATRRLRALTGFTVNSHRLVLVGLCPNCQ